ncbi:GTPase IMAP family member GIMD1-like [Tautogolabrus adspersus]
MALPAEHSRRGNNCFVMLSGLDRHGDDERNVLALNLLLLGGKQSGKSSVGNALIGEEGFQTGNYISDISTTTECQLLSRKYRDFFRRQGAESDLLLRVVDTPPRWPRTHNLHQLCPEGVHIIVLVVRTDLTHEDTHMEEYAKSLFGPDWRRHTLLVLTFTDHLKKVGFQPTDYLTQASDWLRALSEEVEGGVFFMDNSCDWPSIRGRPLREQLLRLSARNHHKALTVRTEVSL